MALVQTPARTCDIYPDKVQNVKRYCVSIVEEDENGCATSNIPFAESLDMSPAALKRAIRFAKKGTIRPDATETTTE